MGLRVVKLRTLEKRLWLNLRGSSALAAPADEMLVGDFLDSSGV